jgi:hypothetical protein
MSTKTRRELPLKQNRTAERQVFSGGVAFVSNDLIPNNALHSAYKWQKTSEFQSMSR